MNQPTSRNKLGGSSHEQFSATRLKIARERRGLTRKALAELSGVTPDSITKFEAKQCRPLPETVQRFTFALQFPINWFYAPELSLLDPKTLSFRSRRSMTKEMRNRATRAGDIAVSVINPELHKRFVLRSSQVPEMVNLEPEQAAHWLRHEWKLGEGPISNMVHLLEVMGIQVYWLNEESPTLNAWSLWHGDQAFVMLNIHNDAGCRARFDAAHELGHLVLHRGAHELDGLEIESQANRFAAAFLLPQEQFKAECPKYPLLNAFFPLKKRWGVSIAAMVMRCKSLDVFSEWDTRRAFQEMASRGWRTHEPDELAIPRETSRLHEMVFERLKNKGLSDDEFARDLFLSLRDVRELMPSFKPTFPEIQSEEQSNIEANEEKLHYQGQRPRLRLVG